VNEYNERASELWDVLMGIEMQLVDQLEVQQPSHCTLDPAEGRHVT